MADTAQIAGRSGQIPPGRIRLIWRGALALLAVLTLAAVWYPIQRISQVADINYNEGWNTYRAAMAAHGDPLYGQPPAFTVTNYPPLSFHILGFLGKHLGGFTAAGRWTALASLTFLAIAMASLVRRFAGHWRFGVLAALLFVLGMAVFVPDRIGMNDPQFFGLAWSFAGLCLYARTPRSFALFRDTRKTECGAREFLSRLAARAAPFALLCASAAAFAISFFIKHNLLAFPAAVGLHLLLARAWKRFAIWLGALAAISAGLLLLTFWWDGPYFFSHLLAPRSYSVMSAWGRVEPYLLDFQIPVAAAAFWSVRYAASSARNLLAFAFVLAHLIGFGFAGGDGVVENVLFDALVMAVLIAAIGIGDLETKLIGLRFGSALLALALLAPFLGIFAVLPRVLFGERQASQLRPGIDAEFRQAAEFLQSRPGPALCEDLLLCFDAGKPPLFDAFYARSQVKIGRLKETDLLNTIQTGRFPTIEIEVPADQPLAPVASFRFSKPVMGAILERYRPVLRGSRLTLMVPRDELEHE